MQVRCLSCGAVFDSNRLGSQFCPHCGAQIQVPGPTGPIGGPADPTSGLSASASTPGGGPPGGPPGPPPGSGSGWPPAGGFGGPPGDGFGSPPSGPGEPPSGGPPARQDTPWERRKEIGLLNALVETWRRTMFSPQSFWPSVKPDADWTDALLYAWLIFGVTTVLRIPLQALQLRQSSKMLDALGGIKNVPPELGRLLEMMVGTKQGTGFVIGFSIGEIIFYPVALFIFAGIVHLFCMLFGCAGNTFWATFRALAYAAAPYVLFILADLPCVGVLFSIGGAVYFFVMAIWGVYRLQDSTPGKAAAAVLAPFVLLCCCCGGLAALAAGTLGAAMRGGGS